MKKPFLFIAGAIAILAALWVIFANGTKELQLPESDIAGQDQISRDNKQQSEYDPLSIPALQQKSYEGTGLTTGTKLSETGEYTRYAMAYKSGPLTITGTLHVPKGAVPEGGFPVIISNHGYIEPSAYKAGAGIQREENYFARQGFVVLHPDYRNYAGSDKDPDNDINLRLGYAEDVINAVHAVRNSDFEYVSKDNIFMFGHSMGGGATLNALVIEQNLVKAVVLYAPVSGDQWQNYKRWTENRRPVAEAILKARQTPEENPSFWRNVSAINFLDVIAVPVTIFHGTADASVPYEWSEDLESKLKNANKNVRLVTYQGQGHEFYNEAWSDFMVQSTDFFRAHLQ